MLWERCLYGVVIVFLVLDFMFVFVAGMFGALFYMFCICDMCVCPF